MPSPPIPPERWRRIEQLFDAALAVPQPDQERWVREQAAGDDEVARQVLALLAADRVAGDGSALRRVISDAAATAVAGTADDGESLSPDLADALPANIGPYRIRRVIGRGGMGIVLLGERDDDSYRQTVAIKVVRTGLGSAERRRRFRRERQILADIDHPNIARLLDGGTMPDGTPYLVMEYVDGLPIDAWCEQQQAGLDTRVGIVRDVCRAVQHAHQSLIVHRDLKPSNILVAGDGSPTVLDFGIAKLLDDDDAEDDTGTSAHILTPSFASPEQLRGDRVTTASDVYALGLVLYELCTGVPAYPRSGTSLLELARQRNDTDAPRASTVGARDRRLAGDLDNIMAKALSREVPRRYATAGALADDLDRYLNHQPVSARPASLPYRVSKLVRRRTREVAIAAAGVVTIVTLTVVNARRLAAERDRARAEATRAEAVADFLRDLFREADPSATGGDGLTARALLDRGAARIDSALAADPGTRASLELAIAEAYRFLGRHEEARTLAERALRTREREEGPNSLGVAEALSVLSAELYEIDTRDSALAVVKRAYEIQRAQLDPPHRDLATTLNNLGWLTAEGGDTQAAEVWHREALAMRRALAPGDDEAVAESLNNLGHTALESAQFALADSLFSEALAMRRRLFGDTHRLVGITMANVAVAREYRGDYAAAATLLRDAIAVTARLYGADHLDQATNWVNLGRVLARMGQRDSAEAAVRRALAIDLQRGAQHPFVAYDRRTLGDLLAAHQPDEAERELLQAHRMLQGMGDGTTSDLAATEASLGRLYLNTGRARDAEARLRRAIELWSPIIAPDHYRIPQLESLLGSALLAQGRRREAESTLVIANRRMEASPAASAADRDSVRQRLAAYYDTIGLRVVADSIRASGRALPP